MKYISLTARQLLPVVATVLLFTVALFVFVLPRVETSIVKNRQCQCRELTQSVWSILSSYKRSEWAGQMSREEAQRQAISRIREMRYGNDMSGYFWINDLELKMILHPYRPDLEHTDLGDYRDPSGKYIFRDIVRLVRDSTEGFVRYAWARPNDSDHITDKVSYVKLFKPWGWVVGTGVYSDDIKAQVRDLRNYMILISFIVLLIATGIAAHLAISNFRLEAFRKQTDGEILNANKELRKRDMEMTRTNAELKASEKQLAVAYEELVTVNQRLIAGERALREREEHYRTLFEKASDAIMILDQGCFVDCNKRTLELFDCRREDILGKRPYELSPRMQPDGRLSEEKAREKVEAALKGEPQLFEWEHRRPDGTPIDAEVNLNEIILPGRSMILAMVRDISDRKKAERAVRESEQKYRMVADNSREAIVVIQDGTIKFFNRRLIEMTGCDNDELLDRPFVELIHPDDRTAVLDRCLSHQDSEKPPGISVNRFLDKNDNIRWVDITAVRINWDDQPATLNFINDITEKKQAEDDRRQLEEKLKRAERMESVGILAGGVAHDLNNILGPLVGYPDLIMMKLAADHPVRKQVKMMGSSAREAAELIQDLLTLARRGRYEMEPTSLISVIYHYLESPGYLKLSEENPKISSRFEIDPSVGNILGSAGHLSKMVMNLIVNAFEAMPDSGVITIGLSQDYLEQLRGGYDDIEPGEYLMLRVADTGIGIERDNLKRIFEPYFSKKKMGTSGSGLGLSVVYGIVKDHHGYYDVFSESGKGTEFILYFPLIKDPVRDEDDTTGDFGGRERILVVDDNPVQRDMAVQLIGSFGYNVAAVSGGTEALAYLETNRVELVVMDMVMEDNCDGLDCYRAIKKISPDQKAIIVSGYSATDRVDQMQLLGAGTFVKKPYTRDAIGRAIREELDRRTPLKVS